MDIDITKYAQTKVKSPPHELAAVVNLFKEFLGNFDKDYPYEFWLKKAKNCSFSQALDIIKGLETLPVKYNKAGVIVNKLNGISKLRTTRART